MFKKTSKFLIPCAILALGNVSSLLADNEKGSNSYVDNCCKPCCVPTCCPEVPEVCCQVCPPTNEVTPKAGPCVVGGSDMYVSADFLFWEANQEGTEFASSSITNYFAPTTTSTTGHVYDIGRKWKPGFKVGVGGDLGHDGWDVFAEYTWFKTNHMNSTPTNTAAGLATAPALVDSYWFVNQPFNTNTSLLASASANWNLKMNVVDLEMGRNMYLSPRLAFRPHFGLKGTWQKQNLNATMLTLATPTFGDVPAGTAETRTMQNHMKNWGVGVRAGFDTAFHFTRELSLVGQLALTGLYEEFKVHRQDLALAAGAAPTAAVSSVNLSHNYYGVKPVVEWVLGLRYEFWTCGDDFHFGFEADWEGQEWFGQNKFIRLAGAATPSGSDLGLQGLTVKARFDF